MSTIAAISTAPGIGGIGIIRLSGEDTFKIIEKIFMTIIKTLYAESTVNARKIVCQKTTNNLITFI